MNTTEESLFQRIFVILVTPVITYFICKAVIWVAFSLLGIYKLLGSFAEGATHWLALGMGLYGSFMALTGQRKKFGIDQASTTSKTGRRISQSVYTIQTLTRAIPLILLTNPFRGVLILGGAGAGKSRSLIEPLIQQTIEHGYAGLLYDFKFPTLAKVATQAMQETSNPRMMYFINFEDLTRSHRVNPLNPATMPTQSHADQYARAILYNLKPDAIKKADFWVESAHSYLTALIWFLREEYPQYCTLPHVMALACQPTAEVVALLSTNPETRGTVASLRESVQRKAEGQTAGVVSTLQTALRKINTKEIVWVLSGDDFDLNINDPKNPKFVTLGNSPTLSSTFAPVIALLATVALKQMNQPGKTPSAVILDEAPTLFIPDFEELPATGRENKVATIFAAQDISQIEAMYGRSKKDALLANLNNQFYGRVGHRETAQYVCDLWGREYVQQRIAGQNESSRDFKTTQGRSVSHSYTQRDRVKIQDVLELNTGEFYGQLVESDFSSFKAQINAPEPGPLPEIVSVTLVTSQDMKKNFIRIQEEIETLLTAYRTPQGQPAQPSLPQPTGAASINGQAQQNGLDRPNGPALPGESLDF